MTPEDLKKKYPNLKPFPKGQSGNPAGGIKKEKRLASIVEQYLDAIPQDKENKLKLPYDHLIALALLEGARNTNTECLKILFNRIDGPLKRILELFPEDSPLGQLAKLVLLPGGVGNIEKKKELKDVTPKATLIAKPTNGNGNGKKKKE